MNFTFFAVIRLKLTQPSAAVSCQGDRGKFDSERYMEKEVLSPER